jgi:hypothetical protein
VSTSIDPDLYAQALADLRAIPTRQTSAPAVTTTPATAVPSPEGCCSGDRTGYQWHHRTGNLPACEESLKANRDYSHAYLHRTGRATSTRRRKGEIPECGSMSGYHAHRRKGEPACEACLEAKREYSNAYYAANQQRIREQRRVGGAA